MTTRYALTRGMNDKLPQEHLPDGQASLIQNMRLHDDGLWESVKAPKYLDSIQFETPHVWKWEPVHMPATAGRNESSVWVQFGDGACMVVWRKEDGDLDTIMLKPIGTYNLAKLRVSWDAQQFVFVDGRDGKGAQRITINPAGEINCRSFGTRQPITAPTINQIDNSKYEDNKYTGMPVGSILFYAYCIINEYGERSNPSPVTVCDTAQWLAKGELLVDEYQYSDMNGGSIKSVSLTCPIPVPEEAKAIELYRTHAEYFESFRPVDAMRLVRSVALTGDSDSVTIADTSFSSPVEIDYENDCAPAGDDIVLESGTLFVANAVSDRTFAYPVERVWIIRLDNQNSINYVNRWFTLDVRDDTHNLNLPHFEGLRLAAAICDDATRHKYRFVDTDMITPLKAYMQPGTGVVQQVNGQVAAFCNLTHIQIPYVMASGEKIIYLVEFKERHIDYGNPCARLDASDESGYAGFYAGMVDNPVRDDKCVVAQGAVNRANTPRVVDGWQKATGNKANAIFDTQKHIDNPAEPTESTAPIYIDSEELGKGLPNINIPIYKQAEKNRWYYEKADGMPGSYSGYVYGRVAIEPVDGEYDPTAANPIFGITSNPAAETLKGFLRLEGASGTGINKIKLWLSVNGVADPSSHYVELDNVNIRLGARANLFVFYSWETQRTHEHQSWEQDCKATLLLLLHTQDGVRKTVHKMLVHPTWAKPDPVTVIFYNYPTLPTGVWYLNLGEYVSNAAEIYALSRFGTHFQMPQTVIGWRSETHDHNIVMNKNITHEAYVLRNEKRPGKIRWSLGAAVPESYERNIYQEIKRIIPVKSFQPTDEHNTLLVWTKDKVLRMSLAGDNREASALITELYGVGLRDQRELARVTQGVIWKDGDAVYLLEAGSIKEIARNTVNLPNEPMRVLYDERNQEALFIPASGNAYCYNLKQGVWSRLNYGVDPLQFIEYDGKWCLVADGVYDLSPTSLEKLPSLIRTKGHPARRKLRRLTIHPAPGKASAIIHNHRLARGSIRTPEYVLTGDDPKGIPQLSGDYVQFEIVTDRLHTYDIEGSE